MEQSKLCYFYGRDSVLLCEKYFLCFFVSFNFVVILLSSTPFSFWFLNYCYH
jgi:hypothetical protein